jgi:hypothetical protein
MRRIFIATLFTALTLSPWSLAGNPPPKLPSKFVEQRVTKLTEKIHWLSSLDEAKELARRQNKPIFWLHALGDLDGTC